MICGKCNEEKGEDFRPHRTVCRECDNAAAREYRKKTKEKKQAEKPESIVCAKCGETKTEFRINRKCCLDCERAHGRKYRHTTTKAKEWVENNRERMSELQHNYYDKEKGNINKKRQERLKSDPLFRISESHRAGIRSFVHNTQKTSKYVNCTRTRFINWIQFLFKDEMTLENHGEYWVLDHVIPVHTFLTGKYPQEAVLNWMNVAPVIKRENLVKYVEEQQCLEHLEKLRLYCKDRKISTDTEYINILEENSRACSILRDTLLLESPKALTTTQG